MRVKRDLSLQCRKEQNPPEDKKREEQRTTNGKKVENDSRINKNGVRHLASSFTERGHAISCVPSFRISILFS